MAEERDNDTETAGIRRGAAHFAKAIWEVIDYHAREYYLSPVEVVGNLEMIKHDFQHQQDEEEKEEDDDGDGWKEGVGV